MSRLWGVDAARGIALLGMMTVHVLPTSDPATGEATWAGMLFAGRSAALFAVLAGVGLALMVGSGGRTGWYRRVISVRAVLIILIGLGCAMLGAGVAIILVHYGLMFLLALPFLRLGARALMLVAAGWLAAAPPLYWWLQNQLRPSPVEPPDRLWHSPGFADLTQPGLLGLDLVVTGYYPLLLWPAYLFVGMAVGRLDLRSTTTQLLLVLFGTAGAAITYAVGSLVQAHSGLTERLLPYAGDPTALAGSLETGDHFLPLISDPLWFLIPMPHQGSTMDLLHTASCAVAALGLCLILSRWAGLALAPLAGAGAMPLSLYVGHLLVLGPLWRMPGAPFAQTQEHTMILLLVAGALVAGAVKIRLRRRGPLEALTHSCSTSLAGERR